MEIITRFAPSPTGNLHIGSIRTALYSWLFARRYNGKFILRIEDTDCERSKSESVQSILDGLKWLGLYWDEGPYFQSKRLKRYQNIIKDMLNNGYAYKCFCSIKKLEEEKKNQILKGEKPRYNHACRYLKNNHFFDNDYVIRFKNPLSGKVIFNDKVRGKISINNEELDDLIIQRSNGIPTYNLCVVVDDLDMNVTHVIRGEDHINNTPRQINILKILGAKIPVYAHVSMIFNEEGQKISKRNNAINIMEYRNNGILPEALLNYIIRLGWSYGNQEIFTLKEMQSLFNLESISKSSSIINVKKMLWINKYYINNLSTNYLATILKEYIKKEKINIKNGPNLESLIDLFKTRNNTLKEIAKSCRYFYEEFFLSDKKDSNIYLVSSNVYILELIYRNISKILIWDSKEIFKIINNLSKEYVISIQIISTLLRFVITGNISSPSISSIIFLMGQEKTLLRIKNAIDYIKNLNN
ncbi:glutamate--tRNA ligase [Buchnera aphidicola]|uniref:glutamate--tRNA ligase n=1 Tax=Buchnera aphidicola TaxID=9 RepID=UPI003BEF1EFD